MKRIKKLTPATKITIRTTLDDLCLTIFNFPLSEVTTADVEQRLDNESMAELNLLLDYCRQRDAKQERERLARTSPIFDICRYGGGTACLRITAGISTKFVRIGDQNFRMLEEQGMVPVELPDEQRFAGCGVAQEKPKKKRAEPTQIVSEVRTFGELPRGGKFQDEHKTKWVKTGKKTAKNIFAKSHKKTFTADHKVSPFY